MRSSVVAVVVLLSAQLALAKGPVVGTECTLSKSLKIAAEPNGARNKTAKNGSVVMILEQAGTWLLISGDGANGYLPAAELQKFCKAGSGGGGKSGGGKPAGGGAAKAAPKSKAKAPGIAVGASCVIADALKVSGAAKGKGAKSDLPANTLVTVKEISKGWLRVESAAGKGWVQDQDLEARCPGLGSGDGTAAMPPEAKPAPTPGVSTADAKPVPAAAFGTTKPEPAPAASPKTTIDAKPVGTPAASPSSEPSPADKPMVPLFGGADSSGNDVFRNASASDSAEAKARRNRQLAWVAIGGGAVGIVGSVVIYALAAQKAKALSIDIEAYAGGNVQSAADYKDLQDRRVGLGHLDSYAAIAFGIGAAALGTGIAVYLLGDDPNRFSKGSYRLSGGDSRASSADWRFMVSPTGIAVSHDF